MAEIANCTRCNAVFVKGIREICQHCYQEEERAFDRVYQFLRQKKNREATLTEIVEATSVEENLIIKFIKEGRLRTSQFPNLAYPCERCGKDILKGKLCFECADELKKDLMLQEEIKERTQLLKEKEKERATLYYSINKYRK